eukprot:747510-Pyramimonas_sp.AAC.1
MHMRPPPHCLLRQPPPPHAAVAIHTVDIQVRPKRVAAVGIRAVDIKGVRWMLQVSVAIAVHAVDTQGGR